MLDVMEAIRVRRSIRRYHDKDVPSEIVDQLLEAARLAPSGANRQPWRFVLVRDREIKHEVMLLRFEQRIIDEAPLCIVCFADLNRYTQAAQKNVWRELADSGIAESLTGQLAAASFWEEMAEAATGSRHEQLIPAVENCAIALEHIVLMATALGLGTCWLGAVDDRRLNRLFGLADQFASVAVLAVGYPAGAIPAQRPRMSKEEILLMEL